MRLVLISDTHNKHDQVEVPDGDVLIHAGDVAHRGRLSELENANAWFEQLPHKHKLLVPGNHDYCFEQQPQRSREALAAVQVLIGESAEIEGIHFYGSPYQPVFHNMAFNVPRGEPLAAKWSLIPDNVDVLITHTPPHGILDRTVLGWHVGCRELTKAVERIRPKVHLFGHIHEAYGEKVQNGTQFINASICTFRYKPTHRPMVIDL